MAENEVFEKLREGLLAFDEEAVQAAAKEAIAEGLDVLKAIDVLTGTIRGIGKKFETGEAFLPELMMAADALNAGTAILTPAIPVVGPVSWGQSSLAQCGETSTTLGRRSSKR